MKINELRPVLKKRLTEIEALCRSHFVERLYVFGSVLTERFNRSSDIDFIVAFQDDLPVSHFHNYFLFKQNLELLFGRKIDLMEEQPIRNPVFREEVESTKQLIYGQESEEMAF
ncbi:MAG: nucleotidyltransferase domain-containing protein [Bacteroidota bacterium]